MKRLPSEEELDEIRYFIKGSFKGLSSTYMLDCITNQKIQDSWKPKVGDVIVGRTGNIFVIGGEHKLVDELGGTMWFFGGFGVARGGGGVINGTACYTMNKSGKMKRWNIGEINVIDDPYHSSTDDYWYVPYPHELKIDDKNESI